MMREREREQAVNQKTITGQGGFFRVTCHKTSLQLYFHSMPKPKRFPISIRSLLLPTHHSLLILQSYISNYYLFCLLAYYTCHYEWLYIAKLFPPTKPNPIFLPFFYLKESLHIHSLDTNILEFRSLLFYACLWITVSKSILSTIFLELKNKEIIRNCNRINYFIVVHFWFLVLRVFNYEF